MKINGREFNFGRCIRIDFFQNNKEVMRVEHCPEVNPDCYVAMDVTVTDMPSALASDKPGFQGKITIYNPSKELLTKVAAGATWLANYVNESTQKIIAKNASTMGDAKRERGMKEYYESRLKAHVWAGYTVDGKPNYTRILAGYVNGSSFYHKGTDDVLSLGIYDIDITEISVNTMTSTEEKKVESAKKNKRTFETQKTWYNSATAKFAETWHTTLEKYIENFETDFLQQKVDATSIDSIIASTTNTKQYKIVYVKSRRAWENSLAKLLDKTILNPDLEKRLKKQQMWNGGIDAGNLAGMLDGLCANAEVPVDWIRETRDVSVNTYVIYPLGSGKRIVTGNSADIQIWNYQNLLETPSIDGAGKMTVKMVFNPKCVCNRTIALMLAADLKQTDVTRDIASFESSITVNNQIVGSMSSTGNDAAVANNQITGNTNVQSQRKQTNDAYKMGYLFNTGFPIIRVEHNLSTYSPNWTTTVKTVPTTSGLKFEV